jgi:hypothetical protein
VGMRNSYPPATRKAASAVVNAELTRNGGT